MMKRLAISLIAATVMTVGLSLPLARAQEGTLANPQGTLKPEPFADVPPDHWAYNAVEQLRAAGLVEGYPDRTFKGKRPMTRYEFARFTQLLLQALNARFQGIDQRIDSLSGVRGFDGITEEQLNDALDELRNQMLTREQVQEIVRQELAGLPGGGVTAEQLQQVQRLVDEFRDSLARLGVDVDAVKKELADLRTRVEDIEARLARMPVISGDLNLIGKGARISDQVVNFGVARPVFDQDGRPVNQAGLGAAPTVDSEILDPVLPYVDLDLGITARPSSDVTANVVINAGNYLSSYRSPNFHLYNSAGANELNLVLANINVPFRFLGVSDITIGRQTTQLTPYTFRAIDPDTYTFVPREDSGDVFFWGAETTWRFGSAARLRAFAGVNPEDGRLLPLNQYVPSLFGANGGTVFGSTGLVGTAPIARISNFAGARLSFGEQEPARVADGAREIAAADESALDEEEDFFAEEPSTTEVASGFNYGPFRNVGIGFNWLLGGADNNATDALGNPVGAQDARGQVYSADAHLNLGPIRLDGEAAFGETQTGRVARPRALNDSALDVRARFGFNLFGLGRLGIGGGWRRIELGYVVPGYWGTLGSWKNPRGIEGFIAQVDLPLRWRLASFLRNMRFEASGEWYEGAQDVTTVGVVPPTVDPNETDLKIDRYQAALVWNLTNRNPVKLGFEQVFRNYVGAPGAAPLSLPTMGVGGSPLVGTRIKNTETYINFGIGHNFTPDISLAALVQLVDFAKYAEDNSNQPANYRGWVATAQMGVRF